MDSNRSSIPPLPKWNAGLLAVCRKCGDKLQQASGAQEQPCISAKDEAKKRLQAAGCWKQTRIVLVDCLDICPDGGVTVMRIRPDATQSGKIVGEIDILAPNALDRLEDALRQ